MTEANAKELPPPDEEGDDDEEASDEEDVVEHDEEEESDEDDDEDDDEAEAALESEIESLRRHLEANTYHYDSHVRLIQLLRRSGDLEGMRAARERMHSLYPLSPQLWLDWIGDERKLLNDGEAVSQEQLEALNGLFRRALDDYASVDVAAEYCVFAIGQLQQQQAGGAAAAGGGADGVRRVFEHCAALVGRFAGRGDQRVWEAWRDFELLELARAEATAAVGAASPAAAEASTAAVEQQRRRVLDVFRRHLSLPHVGLDGTWRELLDWLGDQPAPVELRQAFERSQSELLAIQPFENRLADEPEKSAQHYRDYIAAALGGTAQQLAVFERAVTANCLDTGLWESYVAFVWEQFEPGPKLQRLCQRAVRNCPWSGSLWRQLALCQECTGGDFPGLIRPAYESALAAGLTVPADLLAVWLAYLDAARRHANASGGGDSGSWDDWHRLCGRAVASMDEQFGQQLGDPQACLLRYWALVRATRGEMGEARQSWDQVMKRGHGNSAQMWLKQLEFELRFGDAKHIRRCLSRAVNSVSSEPDCEILLQRLVDYEREEGDLSSYVEALKRARKQRELLRQRAAAQPGGTGKRKAGKEATPLPSQPLAKRPKSKPQPTSQTAIAMKAESSGGAPAATTGEFKKPLPPGAAAAASKKPPPPPPPSHGEKIEHDPAKDHKTVFVSNLAYDVDEPAIRAALGECASDIATVRLVRDYRGRSKGFAYVEFQSGRSANAALKMDRAPINGRPIFVSECRRRHEFQFATGLEQNKLFVRNLPRVMDQSAFAALCAAQPGCRDARLAVFRSGASKCHGYVEFADSQAAANAVDAMNGMQVGDCELEVAISNPPARRAAAGGGGGGGGRRYTAAAASASNPTTDPNRHRTKISLVPRQLKGAPPTAPASVSGGSGGSSRNSSGGGGGLSNEDFRNLIMRK